jgi:hypothetical protein
MKSKKFSIAAASQMMSFGSRHWTVKFFGHDADLAWMAFSNRDLPPSFG